MDNNQMLQKNEQQVMQIQIEENKFAEAQKKEITYENTNNEQMSHESIQKNNIQTVRKMEKMTFKEKRMLTKKATNEFESSEQLQDERRISSLSKARRRHILNKIQKKDEANHLAYTKEAHKKIGIAYKTSAEDTIKTTYFSQAYKAYVEEIHKENTEEERQLNKSKKRHDISGYERRMRASKNKETNAVSEEDTVKDLENLIQNMRLDSLNSLEFKPDEKLDDVRNSYIYFKDLLEERDQELGRQLYHYNQKLENPTHEWPKNLEEVTVSKSELKMQIADYGQLYLMMKGISTNSGADYEVERMNLRSLEKAKQRLVEDNEFEPSVYTQELIQKIDKKIIDQRKVVEEKYDILKKPGSNEAVQEKIEKMNSAFAQLGKCADKLKERKKSLEGLQGEKLAKEQEKVKEFQKGIEKEVRNILKSFRF